MGIVSWIFDEMSGRDQLRTGNTTLNVALWLSLFIVRCAVVVVMIDMIGMRVRVNMTLGEGGNSGGVDRVSHSESGDGWA